jgi:hypothetical protein
MPANIRLRCQFLDCEFLVGVYCSKSEIVLEPKKVCLTYSPVALPDVADDDDEEDLEEEELTEEEWNDEEDDENWDGPGLVDDEE